ncbi:MAG: hypothetical protein GY776_02195 [Alteromonas sp.]|nr:hypothetical protein [Alteromonas sp.]
MALQFLQHGGSSHSLSTLHVLHVLYQHMVSAARILKTHYHVSAYESVFSDPKKIKHKEFTHHLESYELLIDDPTPEQRLSQIIVHLKDNPEGQLAQMMTALMKRRGYHFAFPLTRNEVEAFRQAYQPDSEYRLGLISDLGPDHNNIKPNILYIKKERDKVLYRVMKGGDIKSGEIDREALPDDFPDDVISLEAVGDFLDDILRMTSNKGHTPDSSPCEGATECMQIAGMLNTLFPGESVQAFFKEWLDASERFPAYPFTLDRRRLFYSGCATNNLQWRCLPLLWCKILWSACVKGGVKVVY